jgi:L-seryl-tRNA(Ser) seleniumtransferase
MRRFEPADADARRRIPPVDHLLRQAPVRALTLRYGRDLVRQHLRALLEDARERAVAERGVSLDRELAFLPERLSRRLEQAAAPSLRTVINATGVVIHTNLGRAPLSARAASRVAEVAASYTNLEFDLASGARGEREVHADQRLRSLLGGEAALVVNNNAAAVLLAVNTLAEGREVVVSRGELVEIGGSFRIPEVLRKGGARLREVGTTNRTRISDYRSAITAETALLLKVHPSNFRIVGYTEAPTVAELATLAREAGLPFVEDLGSGLLCATEALPEEPAARASLQAGADLVTFSADKLLGGPQAGVLAGRRSLVDAMRKNPLYRALRVDKMTLAALDQVLADHQAGRAAEAVPVARMLAATAATIGERARALVAALQTLRHDTRVVEGVSAVGGGSAPAVELPTALVALEHPAGPDRLAAALRAGEPPVVARVVDGRVVLDLRTVAPEQDEVLRDAIERACLDVRV